MTELIRGPTGTSAIMPHRSASTTGGATAPFGKSASVRARACMASAAVIITADVSTGSCAGAA